MARHGLDLRSLVLEQEARECRGPVVPLQAVLPAAGSVGSESLEPAE